MEIALLTMGPFASTVIISFTGYSMKSFFRNKPGITNRGGGNSSHRFGLLLGFIFCFFFRSTLCAAPPALGVIGNKVVTSGNCALTLRGVDVDGLEFSSTGYGPPSGTGGSSLQVAQEAVGSWHSNIVRVPLNQDYWFGCNGANMANYQSAVSAIVSYCSGQNAYVILDLHWSGTSSTASAPCGTGWGSAATTKQQYMADANSVTFWSSVASAYANNPAVFFDLYNEPFSANGMDNAAAWNVWLNGGTGTGAAFSTPGMQLLLNTVRATGANNICLMGGLRYCSDLNNLPAASVTNTGLGVIYSAHFYGNNDGSSAVSWNADIPATFLSNYPVFVGEYGPSYNMCNTDDATFDSNMFTWLGSTNGIVGATAWSMTTNSCPNLLSAWGFTTSSWGAAVSTFLQTPLPTCSSTGPTNTPTRTFTNTPTRTPTNTSTNTSTFTATNTITRTFTATNSFTFTSTSTNTPTRTFTNTSTPTMTFTAVNTLTMTATRTPTFTSTNTLTSTSTGTNTPTRTFTSTSTNSFTATPTRTNTATLTPTNSLTATNSPTGTLPPTNTFTQTFTWTRTATATETPSNTATLTKTFTGTATYSPTNTFSNTSTPTRTFTVTSTSTATTTNTPSHTNTPTHSFTPTVTNSLTYTHTGTQPPTNTVTNTATMTTTFSWTATSSATKTFTPTQTFTVTSTVSSTPTLTNTRTMTPSVTDTFTAITSITQTITPVLEPVVYPNPSDGTQPVKITVPFADIKLSVFTLSFRKVVGKTYPPQAKGFLTLDLVDNWGTPLASGIYYLRLEINGTGKTVKIKKILILR